MNVAPWQASAAVRPMATAPVRLSVSCPFVTPTRAGTVQPAPALVWVVKLSVASPQPLWAASTAKPALPWVVSSASDGTCAGKVLGFERTSARTSQVSGVLR